MLDKNIHLLIAAGGLLAASHNLLKSVKNHRQEMARLDESIANQELDIIATRRAHDTMIKRIEEGYYDTHGNFFADYTREIEFEKIAIRLQD